MSEYATVGWFGLSVGSLTALSEAGILAVFSMLAVLSVLTVLAVSSRLAAKEEDRDASPDSSMPTEDSCSRSADSAEDRLGCSSFKSLGPCPLSGCPPTCSRSHTFI